MGCITNGHAVACEDKNRRGGIKRIWLIEQDSVDYDSIVFNSTTGMVDEFDTVASTGFAVEFQFERETAGFNANASRENGSTIVDVELEFYVPKLTAEVNARLSELTCSCGVVAIVESFADDGAATPSTYFFLLGWDQIFGKEAFLEFASGEMGTGVALQDANGTAIKLSGRHGEYPLEIAAVADVANASSASSIGDNKVGIVKESDWATTLKSTLLTGTA
jgi:hypothetical protein